MTIGENIRLLRKENGLTQKECLDQIMDKLRYSENERR